MDEVVHLREKLARLEAHWTPGIVAQLNDYHVKVVKALGEFTWHRHTHTDELFLVLNGELRIRLRTHEVVLRPGDLYVVTRGVEHQPVAEHECELLLLEPAGTGNTGDTPGDLTVADPRWL